MNDDWTDEDSDISDDEIVIKTDEDEPIEELEAPKRGRGRPRIVERVPPVPKEKKKRELTQKQLDALARGRANRDAKRAERKTDQDETAKVKKQQRDEAIVKKAKRIRKKEIIEEAVLQLSSEDEEDDLTIKQVKRVVAKRKQAKKQAPKTKEPQNKLIEEQPQAYIFY